MPKQVSLRKYILDISFVVKIASLVTACVIFIPSQYSLAANNQETANTQTFKLDVPSEKVELNLGISRNIDYSIVIERPVILHLHIEGEVQKKVSGGFYGRPSIKVIQSDTGYIIPSWKDDIVFDENSLSKELFASYLLNKGNYIINLQGTINGWSRDANYEKDALALKLSTKIEDLVIPAWLSQVNSWLNEIGLGDKIRILATSSGPSFGFNASSNNKEVQDLVMAMVRSQRGNEQNQYAPDEASESSKFNKLGEDKLFIFVSTQLDRKALGRLEQDFTLKHGISLWSRLFRKITLLTGIPSKDIFGLVPVWCDATDLYETSPGVVHRHGSICLSASFARDTPKWITERLGSTVTRDSNGGIASFAKVVEKYLNVKVKSIGGTLEYLYREDTYVEAIIRNVRGWVVKGNSQWEKVQIAFALMGKDNTKIRIFVDGMLASGLGNTVPPDSKFTYSMEPEYASNITTHAQAMLDDFINHKGDK